MTNAERLEAVLDRLHLCILAAQFDELPKILTETEHLVGGLTSTNDLALFERMRSKASRNAACLLASAKGYRAAQRRLSDANLANIQLSTYTKTGKRAEVSFGQGVMAKRL